MSVWRYIFQISEESSNPRHFLIDRKPLKRYRVLTEETLDDIGLRLENSPRISLRRLALQSGVSVGSTWTATKKKKLHDLSPRANYTEPRDRRLSAK
jgi:hypothetical protein